jgi:FkbM family methyltransferase
VSVCPETGDGSKALFPVVSVPYTCSPGNGVPLKLNIRQPFITKDPQPISYTMYVHPAKEDIWVSATIYENEGNNMFEMNLREMMYQRLRGIDGTYRAPKNPLFIDAGANIGSHSLFLAALKVRVHAFEPMPRNLNLLRCSASSNAVMTKSFVANGFGLSNEDSDGGCMVVDADNQGNAFFVRDASKCKTGGIKVRKLDEYWKQMLHEEHVFMMKMDVQGFEGFLLQGGAEMFSTKPPVFFWLEYSPTRYREYHSDGEKILRDLLNWGYSIRNLQDDNQEITLHNGQIERLARTDREWDMELVHTGLLEKLRAGRISFDAANPF